MHRRLPAFVVAFLTAFIGAGSLAPFVAPAPVDAAGAATHLVFTTQPGGGPAWAAFATQPIVAAEDDAGNVDTSYAGTVALAIAPLTGTPGATLTCTGGLSSGAVSGIATFAGCAIDKPGNGYTITASDGSLTDATTLPFNVTAAQEVLVFTSLPGGGPAGTAFATQPVIEVQDPGGAKDATSTVSITLQLGSNPSGGTLSCTGSLSKAAVAGVATFSGCKIDKPGNGYTITATALGITGVTSAPFNVQSGAAAKIVFSTQPGGAAAGQALNPQPVVTVQDASGYTVTTSSANVGLAILAGTGTAGAVLTCTGGTTQAAVAGVATFAGCSISKAGTGYKLVATTGGLPTVTSSATTINSAPPTQLIVTTQPSASAGAATAFAVQPIVAVRDATGQTVTTSTAAVTLSITPGTGTGGAVLACTGGTTKTAVAGIATFSGCNIDLLGAGYTLLATAAGLTSATTAAIAIVPGAAARLAFTTQPVGGAYGVAFPTQPVVTIQDSQGNTVTGSSASVTLAISTGTGTAGATLACAGGNAKVAVASVATFAGCTISKAGSAYKLTATSTGLTAAQSIAFDLTVGAAAKLAFLTQPGGGAVGGPLAAQPIVVIQDAGGNTVTSSVAAVTLAITGGTGTPGATLSCTTNPVAATAGIAAFAGCSIDKVGTGYTISATSAGLTTAVSGTIAITAGAPAKLALTNQPGGGTVGTVMAQQPVVVVQDAAGNTVTTSTLTVTLSIGTNPSAGTLTCTGSLSKAAVAGIATFAGCKIDKVGIGYTITATATGLFGATSAAFDISAGVPQRLTMVSQPSGGQYGVAFATQPSVAVVDSLNNVVTSYAGAVVLAVTPLTGASGATLTCTGGLSKALASGIAAFAGCAIDKPAAGYTLTATMTGVTNAVSTAFTITPGAASQLAFSVQPAGASAGVAFTIQPKVKVLDAAGNIVTGSSAVIALAITAGSGTGGATFSCTGSTSATAVNGVATFAGCKIDLVGNGYMLTTTSTALTGVDSAAFAVAAGPAAKLTFTVQPAGAAVGTAFTTQPVIAIQDAGGNTVATSVASVTLSITTGTGTSGAALTCTGGLTTAAVNGLATFSGCQLSKVGVGYTLKASSGSLAAATSGALTVGPGAAAKLAVTTQPSGAAYATAFGTQPVITIQDASGNTATQSNLNVTLAVTAGTGAAGASLSCGGAGTTVAAVAGIATFGGCSIDKVGTGYTLTATAAGVTGAVSAAVTITAGAPAKLVFTTQPAGTLAATAFGTQPVVKIQDAGGNVVTSSTLAVTLGVTPGSGTLGAVLSCGTSLSKAAVAGVATFASCKLDLPGAGYTLTATSGALTAGVSASVDISSGPAAKVAFTTQPVGGTLNVAFPTQPVVTIQDSGGNTVTSANANVTLSITPATGAAGAVLTCTGGLIAAAVNGVATFAGCTINKAGAGYTLKATSGTFNATSAAVGISAGPAAQLAFAANPAGAAVGVAFTTQPTITVQDAGGGTSVGSSAAVTLAIGTNPAGGTLTCTGGLTKAAVAGIVAFSGCTIDKLGAGYTLVATSGILTGATSATVTVAAGPPAQLVLTAEPGGSTAYGIAFAVQPVVAIEDAAGNVVTSSKLSVSISITPGTGVAGAKLTCTGSLSRAAVAGVATFAGCAIDKAAAGYTLTVSSGALTTAVTGPISITPGTASKLVFTTNPSSTAGAGSAFATQPVVAIQDAVGNLVTTSTLAVTLALVAPANSTAALTCTSTLTVAAVAGVATFAGCAIDKTGTGFAINASAPGIVVVKSTAIGVTAGAPAKVDFAVQPAGAAGGATLAKQPAVAIQDAGGNTVTTSTVTVTLAIDAGTGLVGTQTVGAVLTCTGGLSKAAVSGVATFAGCTIDKAGTGYKLTATVTSLTAATSTTFDISQGPAAKLGFTTDPTDGPGGIDFPSQPVVAIQDAGGAAVATATGTVTLAITTGTGTSGAVLSCTGGLAQAAVDGVATFSGCTIDRAGTGYTLTASAGSLTAAVSKAFNVSAPVALMALSPASSAIRLGQALDLGVAFSFGGADATVNVEESLDGTTWTVVSPVTANSQGVAHFVYLITTSRWFRTTFPGDRTLLPGTSKPIHVLVQYATTVTPAVKSTKTIERKTSITFTAAVRPTMASTPRTKVTFEVYKRVGKKWAFVTRRVVATTALGQAKLKWTFAVKGTWSIRTRAAGTSQNATSPWTAYQAYKVV
jgi:hypothetical protein